MLINVLGKSVLHHLMSNPLRNDSDTMLVQALVEHGCDLSATDSLGESLLHTIFRHNPWQEDVEMKFKALIELLTAHKEMSSVRSNDGVVPLQVAIRHRLNPDFIRLAIPPTLSDWNSVGFQSTPFHDIFRGQVGMQFRHIIPKTYELQCLDTLLAIEGADINVPDGKGESLLMWLSQSSAANPLSIKLLPIIFKRLLEAGADVNEQNKARKTILHHISSYGGDELLDCVVEILKYHPKLDVLDEDGFAPIHHAIMKENFEITRLFVDQLDDGHPGPANRGCFPGQ